MGDGSGFVLDPTLPSGSTPDINHGAPCDRAHAAFADKFDLVINFVQLVLLLLHRL